MVDAVVVAIVMINRHMAWTRVTVVRRAEPGW